MSFTSAAHLRYEFSVALNADVSSASIYIINFLPSNLRDAFDLEDVSIKRALPLHHLYVCPKHSVELKKETAFREFLKQNKAYAERLSDLKWLLAEKYDNDRQAYMAGKEALCREITEKALEYSGKNG